MKKNSPFKVAIFALLVITGIYIVAFFYGEKIFSWKNQKQEILNTSPKENICFLWKQKEVKKCFKIYIAKTDQERVKWLMFVKNLQENEGMLFAYEQEWIYSFWMKNTLISLDMIWIDKDRSVIDIQTAQPCKTKQCPSYTPKWKAVYILEINAELSEKYGISRGTKAEIILTN